MSVPKRMPHAAVTSQLLSEIAPELALRWVTLEATGRCASTLPASLHSGIISLLLRAASAADASAAYSAAHLALSLPVETPGARLGFSSATDKAAVAAILIDLTVAAARNDPLLPSAPALRWYSGAGPGVCDVDEYQSASADHRAKFCTTQEPLECVRSGNLALTMELFAAALETCADTAEFICAAVEMKRAAFIAPFTDMLPMSIGTLHAGLRTAMQRFYTAYFQLQPEHVLTDVHSRLLNAFMRLAFDRPESLGVYVQSVGPPIVKLAACRLCLTQRFHVDDQTREPMTAKVLFKKYLKVMPVSGAPNAAVIPLLVGVMIAWLDVASEHQLQVGSGQVREAALEKHLLSLKAIRRRLSTKFGGAERDVAALRTVIIILANRLIEANS